MCLFQRPAPRENSRSKTSTVTIAANPTAPESSPLSTPSSFEARTKQIAAARTAVNIVFFHEGSKTVLLLNRSKHPEA
jgi:hypothetical protein